MPKKKKKNNKSSSTAVKACYVVFDSKTEDIIGSGQKTDEQLMDFLLTKKCFSDIEEDVVVMDDLNVFTIADNSDDNYEFGFSLAYLNSEDEERDKTKLNPFLTKIAQRNVYTISNIVVAIDSGMMFDDDLDSFVEFVGDYIKLMSDSETKAFINTSEKPIMRSITFYPSIFWSFGVDGNAVDDYAKSHLLGTFVKTDKGVDKKTNAEVQVCWKNHCMLIHNSLTNDVDFYFTPINGFVNGTYNLSKKEEKYFFNN